jgi:signal transduction histidine kinase
LKIALSCSAFAVVLLALQAMGVSMLAEKHEERLINALISDDIACVLRSYNAAPSLLPPFDQRMNGYVLTEPQARIALPADVATLSDGIHEIRIEGRPIHVAIARFQRVRLYRVYDFSRDEMRFKSVVDSLVVACGVLALAVVWLSYGVSGLIVRQIVGLTREVKELQHRFDAKIDPGRYDDVEIAGLVEVFNVYHQRMADMILREKEFTGNVSHEMRTPLTTIVTSVELLEQHCSLAPQPRVWLAQIERAVVDMRDMFNALLFLARDEEQTGPQSLHLATLVREVLEPFAEALKGKGIAIIVDIDDAVCVDAGNCALRIVLSNLISNAARYTIDGHIGVRWGGGVLRVEDTGTGIETHTLPHVFERLYRANGATATAEGYGIGLAIVRKVCTRYGWTIDIESKSGVGTSVSLFLPRAIASQSTVPLTNI